MCLSSKGHGKERGGGDPTDSKHTRRAFTLMLNSIARARVRINYQKQQVKGLPRVPQLPPPHHSNKVRDAPLEHPAVAAEEGEGARRRCRGARPLGSRGRRVCRRGGADERGSKNEGQKRGLDVHRVLKGGEKDRAEKGSAEVALEDGWVDVAVVAVGSPVQNQLLGDQYRRPKINRRI